MSVCLYAMLYYGFCQGRWLNAVSSQQYLRSRINAVEQSTLFRVSYNFICVEGKPVEKSTGFGRITGRITQSLNKQIKMSYITDHVKGEKVCNGKGHCV